MNDWLRFGRHEIRPAQRELLSDGAVVPLGTRAFDLLLALAERRDRIVTKNELLELAWPGLVVEENNLQVQVSALRKVLGANAIATIPGRGYRFCLEPSADPGSPAAAAASNATAVAGLPPERTPLIGREVQLAECVAQLRDTRLLTLTGIGGTGKTRLAIAVARNCAGTYRDGAAFVDLASVSEPARVGAAVAAALRVDDRPGAVLTEVLVEQLATRELLLVLDNCEHLLAAAAELADALIGQCGGLNIVATSREPLGVVGEAVYRVPPLALPPATNDVAELAHSEAVQLFVSQVKRTLPAFELDVNNARHVARICRQLDGVPLALELAAARVAVLDIAHIADRLDQRFRLLTGGRAQRQQTLEAVVRWSWDHLAARDQQLLAMLSVFAGSFVLETALSVAAASDEFEVLDGLARLHATSLVVIDAGKGETRYRMLDTVREFARLRLDELRQTEAARERHLRAVIARAEASKNSDDNKRHAEFLAEVEDYLAAHAWCDRTADGGRMGLRLALALSRRWLNAGMLQVGQRVTEQALARPDARDPGLRGWLLYRLALLRMFGGDRAGGMLPLQEVEAIGRTRNLPALVASALAMQSDLLPPSERDLPKTKAMAAEAAALARTLPEPDGPLTLAAALTSYGNNLYWLDELAAAEAAYQETFAINSRIGSIVNTAVAASNIIDARLRAGSDRGVRDLLLHISEVEMTTRSSYAARLLARGCMQLALHRKQWRDALVLRAAEKALALDSGMDPEPLADIPAKLAAARAAIGTAAADEAESAGAAMTVALAVAHARAWLSQRAD